MKVPSLPGKARRTRACVTALLVIGLSFIMLGGGLLGYRNLRSAVYPDRLRVVRTARLRVAVPIALFGAGCVGMGVLTCCAGDALRGDSTELRTAAARAVWHISFAAAVTQGALILRLLPHLGTIFVPGKIDPPTLYQLVTSSILQWPAMQVTFVASSLVIVIHAFYPALAAHLDQRRRRISRHCLTCGYDLTGNVSGRCPECGTPSHRPPDPLDHDKQLPA